MHFSILFATFHNEGILQKTLQAYCQLESRYDWELIIVDNAGREKTRQLVESYAGKLPIQFLVHTAPGKNAAINHAIPHISGSLVMFTDNDILPSTNIVDIYVEAAQRYPDFAIFTGKILPDRPIPQWIDTQSTYVRSALAIYDKGEAELPVQPDMVWGGNMVLRSDILSAHTLFNPDIGPRGRSYVMGGDTEFMKRLQHSGHRAIYLPSACVEHQIRDEQLNARWLRDRSFRLGRGVYFYSRENAQTFMQIPRFLIRHVIQNCFQLIAAYFSFSKSKICVSYMTLYFNLGKISQSRRHNVEPAQNDGIPK